ncbi:hypothetical protein Tco_0992977 [Tanacetum coccineum]|uniref:Uncharacterized protein n=1 Tax=Tanacetum coccineum TaxID=301880 RepID=A0ABQ5F4C5_9ASTR
MKALLAVTNPDTQFLQMLWGIVTQTNVDHAELLWEEFTQGIQTFFSHKASHKASLKNPKKKVTPLLIPYGRFSKFVPKGESVEVFGMAIPDPLITEAIQQSSYYPKYLEMVAENTKKTPQESRAPFGRITIRDPDQKQLPNCRSKWRDQTPHDSTTGPSSQPEDDTSEKVIHESSSTSDSERTESETEAAAPKGDKDQDEVDTSTVTSGVSIPVSDPEKAHEALAGPDPEPMKEDQTGSDSGKLHVSLAGPNPEHMDDEFLATAYLKVHENLKLITDERVIDDKPESHSGSMSSMKNLDDTVNFGDQFLYDKPTEDDQEKSKVREESDSTLPDPSHQTVTSTPPVIAPFTDVSSTKPSSLKTDHRLMFGSIKSQVPTAVDKYLGTKLDDALLKILERHTADLIEKYSVLPGLESVKNQESEKDLIADEDAMIRNFATMVIDHKRKHKVILMKDDDDVKAFSWIKPGYVQQREEDLNLPLLASKQLQLFTSTGWQITDTRDVDADSSMHRSDPESEHSEQSSDDIPMQDEGNDSDMEDTDNAHIPKVSTTTWFKPILESERPATPEPEWTIPPNDFPEPENNWANTYATTYKVPEENKLQRKTYDIGHSQCSADKQERRSTSKA